MRSAERGPMPGSFPSAAVSAMMGSGSEATRYIMPGKLKPCVILPISALEISFACVSA